jgi:predicted pyridoxine 5'-phosphate oxidase superfamily flavin-nucleotide-binding protein
MAIQLTDTIRDLLNAALADGSFCLVGTASKDGHPQISPKGSVVVFSDDHLCYWERSNRSAAKRVLENPHVCVYYRNVAKAGKDFRGGVIRFYGEATVLKEGADRDKVWELIPEAERKPDPEKKGSAVLIKLTSVEEMSGNVVMKRD